MTVNVSIYGLSSEGYSLASILTSKGLNVSIIDELKTIAINISPQIASSYHDINALMEEEPLLRLEPQSRVIQSADYIFFAPRIRKIEEEARDEIINKFKDAITDMKRDASVIFNIPLGLGVNQEFIELIKRFTGYDEISYHYMPLGLYTNLIGSNKYDDRLFNMLNTNENPLQALDIESTEIVYTSKVLSYYLSLISSFEVYKNTNQVIDIEEAQGIYIDDISSGLFDLRMISLSLSSSNPLSYLVNGSVKSIESYTKYMVDKIKKILKTLELRGNNTRLYLIWSMDKNEIRGDKIYMANTLRTKLEDYIADVKQSYANTIDDKTPVIILCSRHDYNNLNIRGMKSVIKVKANPFCEVIKD